MDYEKPYVFSHTAQLSQIQFQSIRPHPISVIVILGVRTEIRGANGKQKRVNREVKVEMVR